MLLSRCCIHYFVLVISTLLLISFPVSVQAQSQPETIDFQQVEDSSTTFITDPINLPDPTKETIFTGSGEPGASIAVIIYVDNAVIFQQATFVNSSGQWRITVPPLNQTPTSISLTSQVEITPLQEIETVTVTTAAAVSSLVVLQLILDRLLRTFQVLGLLGQKRTRGFVFDVATKKPVPFAVMTIENAMTNKKILMPQLKETAVSDVEGFFKTASFPPGSYTLKVDHPDYVFPARVAKPWYATLTDFYQGETIALGGQHELGILFVPLQAKGSPARRLTHWLNIHVFATVAQQLAKILSVPMGLISVGILLFFPSFVNFLIVSLYAILGIQTVFKNTKKRSLKAKIKDDKNNPVENAVVRIYRTLTEADELAAVALSNKAGAVKFRLPPGKYRALISKDGLVSTETSGLSYESIDLQKSIKNLQYTMKPALKPSDI